MVSNSQQNGSKMDKTVSVDDGHVNAPRESSIMEITLGPKTVSNSARNGPESAKNVSVDDRHVKAPQGSYVVEITLGPENSE